MTPLDVQEVHLEEEYTITANDVFLDFKTMKAGKTAGSDEILPVISKALNREGLILTRVC